MQEVLPRIYMGPSSVAQDLEVLRKHQITHILAIGWDLKAHFPDQFEYLLINKVEDRPGFFLLPYFAQAFEFIDRCLNDDNINENKDNVDHKYGSANKDNNNNNNNNSGNDNNNNNNKNKKNKKDKNKNKDNKRRIFVHCHKGLSRSASIIIGYEMKRTDKSFEIVYNEIRKSRSFIMPNIGFQVQLQVFHRLHHTLDMAQYANLDIYQHICEMLPTMLNVIIACQNKFAQHRENEVDDQELFEITMYFHQVDMLHRSGNLKQEKAIATLREAVRRLRTIQVQYIGIESSIKRFDNLFRLDSNGNPIPEPIKKAPTTTTTIQPKEATNGEKRSPPSSKSTVENPEEKQHDSSIASKPELKTESILTSSQEQKQELEQDKKDNPSIPTSKTLLVPNTPEVVDSEIQTTVEFIEVRGLTCRTNVESSPAPDDSISISNEKRNTNSDDQLNKPHPS